MEQDMSANSDYLRNPIGRSTREDSAAAEASDVDSLKAEVERLRAAQRASIARISEVLYERDALRKQHELMLANEKAKDTTIDYLGAQVDGLRAAAKKCEICACGAGDLLPCPLCDQPVTTSYSPVTSEHCITHADWNSRCQMKPFFGTAAEWNERPRENRLHAEIVLWIKANNNATQVILGQHEEIMRLRKLVQGIGEP